MELRNYVEILQRRRGIVAVTVLVAFIVALLGFRFIEPTYVAASTLRFGLRSPTTLDYSTLEYTVRLKNTFADLAVSDPALTAVQAKIGGVRTIDQLRKNISVQFPNNNELMTVVVRDSDPLLAATIANEVASLLIDENQTSTYSRAFVAEPVSSATVPTRPDNTNRYLIPLFGILTSLLAGFVLALLVDNFDTTIHSEPQATAAVSLPLIGSVPRTQPEKTPQCYNGSSAEGEAFRQLRTNLAAFNQDRALKAITVTSAEPGEGKSLVAANLAYSLAQQGKNVVVVDGDLRIPTLHKTFKLANDPGLADVLAGKAELDQVIHKLADKKISVITSGTSTTINPADLLSSPELAALIKQLTEKFDIVVIDSPALLAVADSTLISTATDGAILVVRYNQSRKDRVQTAFEQMVEAEIPLLGMVATNAKRNPNYEYYQHR